MNKITGYTNLPVFRMAAFQVRSLSDSTWLPSTLDPEKPERFACRAEVEAYMPGRIGPDCMDEYVPVKVEQGNLPSELAMSFKAPSGELSAPLNPCADTNPAELCPCCGKRRVSVIGLCHPCARDIFEHDIVQRLEAMEDVLYQSGIWRGMQNPAQQRAQEKALVRQARHVTLRPTSDDLDDPFSDN